MKHFKDTGHIKCGSLKFNGTFEQPFTRLILEGAIKRSHKSSMNSKDLPPTDKQKSHAGFDVGDRDLPESSSPPACPSCGFRMRLYSATDGKKQWMDYYCSECHNAVRAA